ncbi:MAG TPA: type II secretion system F family protein [Kofleriaceae bacterium]|nr:type II secretion system F family protein [Kofleriaceae bacterium]
MDGNAMQLVAAGASASASAFAFVAWRRTRVATAPDAEGGSAGTSLIRRLVAPVAGQLRPTSQAELEHLTTTLMNAGRRSRDAVDRFCEERVLFILAGMVLALTAAAGVGGLLGLIFAMGALLLGIVGPARLVGMQAADRRDAVARQLPPAVDLLTTCIEAGLSLEQAIARVGREIAVHSPILAEEMALTAGELEAGVSLPDALRRMARRVGLDDLSALCGVIAQAHGLGAPIGNTLREYAQSSRQSRMSMLEERAGKLAAQLTIPLATCLLPASMLIIIGPAVIQLVRALQ